MHTCLHHLSWFLFVFYPCENLEFVFISMPSSSSSKTDFIWISCGVFDVGGFTGLSLVERSNSPLVLSSSHDGLWCVYAWSCSACDYLRSKPKIIEDGVWMENLLRFRVGNIIGLSVRKVPHLPMCANLTLFMVLNISTFCREALVVIFPT